MPKINDSRYVAVAQNPAYSQTHPLDPFRDLTLGKNAKHNRHLPLFQSNPTALQLLHGERLRTAARNWHQYFLDQHGFTAKKLIVEIGCYKGKNLAEMALRQPNTACIGIDYTFKRVALTAQRLQQVGSNNAVAVLYDAHALHLLFAEQRVDGLICFFPDPWLKRKQGHNRLWSKDFCASIANILADDAYVWLKTDVASFFHNAKGNLEGIGLSRQQSCLSQQQPCLAPLDSEFEARYRKMRRSIYAGVFSLHV